MNRAKASAAKVEAAIAAGRFDDADRLAEEGLARHVDHPALLEQYAFSAHNSGRYAAARDRWDRLRDHVPSSAMAWNGAACNRRELGDVEAAAVVVLQALERFPGDGPLLGEAHRIFLKCRSGGARARLKAALGHEDVNLPGIAVFTAPPGSPASKIAAAPASRSRPGDIVSALALLTPYETDRRKIRIGPPIDGGYIFLDMFDPEQAVLSYGIGGQYGFDSEMAARGHDVFMFDHTIAPPTSIGTKMHFVGEGLAGSIRPDAKLSTVAEHLERFAIRGDRLVLKMDAEGAEYEAFDSMDDSVLARFEQMSIEFHFLNLLDTPAFREVFIRVFEKINRRFTLFHVHANNHDGPDTFAWVGGLPIPQVLELSYVRTDRVARSPNRTAYPTEFDVPSVEARDKRLWMFPFLPSEFRVEMLRESWEFTERLAGGFRATG